MLPSLISQLSLLISLNRRVQKPVRKRLHLLVNVEPRKLSGLCFQFRFTRSPAGVRDYEIKTNADFEQLKMNSYHLLYDNNLFSFTDCFALYSTRIKPYKKRLQPDYEKTRTHF